MLFTIAEKTQLLTGLIILFVASGGYIGARTYYIKKNRLDLLPFLKYYMLAGFLIGMHQIFEFLSLFFQNSIIYKIGLLISLSGMIIYGISLEKLYNKNFYLQKLGIIGLMISTIYLFSKQVAFTTLNFHLTHHSIFLWTFIWLFLLIYWNICILFGREKIKLSLAILYPLLTMMLSFFISIGYSLFAYFSTSENICTNFPSVWCTFAVLQIFFIPIFLILLPKMYPRIPSKSKFHTKQFLFYLVFSILVTIFILFLLSKTGCFNLQFIFA